MAYTIIYSRDAQYQLKALKQPVRKDIEKAIDRYLLHQPDTPGKKRKRLRPNPIAEWQLRVREDWRVLYNVYKDEIEVVIVAIGWKPRETLSIDGEEVEL